MDSPTTTSPEIQITWSSSRRLMVLCGPDETARRRCVLLEDRQAVLLGRRGSVPEGLALDDSQISRQHATVEPDEDSEQWVVRDLGSRNGTFVNGKRCERAELQNGDVIRIGATMLLHQVIEVAKDAPLAAESGRLLGKSVALSRVRGDIGRVATAPISVLILGETGTGKELVAQQIHAQSGRSGQFVPVNCAAIPHDLVESELFGHAAGAFTGATGRSDGLFVAADHGTLFLDEIRELPELAQAKLLRVLAESQIRPVGETTTRQVDVRVIAATNRDLRVEVDEGRFRDDLYSRLAGWIINLPPLRQRRDDILRLGAHFLAAAGCERELSPNAAEALLIHPWRFNVRELEQTMKAVAVRAAGAVKIDIEHLPPELCGPLQARASRQSRPQLPLAAQIDPQGTPTEDELRRVFEHYQGNIAQVAAFFSRDRRQVYRWAKRYGIEPETFRQPQ